MNNPIMVTLLFACISLRAAPQGSVTANTGAPVLLEGGSVTFPMPEEEYGKLAEKLSKNPRFVPIKRRPAGLTDGARFGINLVFGGLNRSWVLDGDERQGYVLYADLNGNGDLADDTPLRFENNSGKYSALLKQTVTERIDGRDENYPVEIRLDVGARTGSDKSHPQIVLTINGETLRRGVIRAGGSEIAFALAGSQGIYNWDYNRVYFDLNGDGKLDLTTQESAESYVVNDKYVNLAGSSYEFTVDRQGRSITLKPLAEKLPDRASLELGNGAPEFSLTDINGKPHQLSDYRGKVLLLDFWGVWCAPCVAEAPKLAAIYKKLHEKGFEIIGIHMGKEMAALRKFIAEKGMTWAQAAEDERGALHRLFRVHEWPTYYLIGKDGTIRANHLRPGDELTKAIEQQFSSK